MHPEAAGQQEVGRQHDVEVGPIDGHDLAAVLKAYNKAKKSKSGKPQLSPEAIAMQQMMQGIHF